MSDVFCDDLRVTVPGDRWELLRSAVSSALADIGMAPEYSSDDRQGWRLDGGTVVAARHGFVRSISASGQALARMRSLKLLGNFLAVLGSGPHRVTGIHCTMDVREPTPAALTRLLDKALSPDGLRAGRKRIPASALQRYLMRQPDGSDTGSVYCGSKSNEIRPVVYDKRQERIARGLPDLGHALTRYELRLRGVGASLRDAYAPASLFWHYMAPDFLPCPPGVPGWSSGAEGFELPRADDLLPSQRLLRRLEGSEDVADLVRLASGFPGGLDLLCARIRRLADTAHDRGAGVPPAETALPDGLVSAAAR